jgi:8-amino-7-oxononanoate synthase
MSDIKKDLSRLSPEEKRRLLEKMVLERAGAAKKPVETAMKMGGFLIPEEYRLLPQRFEELEKQGYGSIYSLVSEGINNHTTSINGREFINFTSYNYIGMSGDPYVSEAAKRAIDKYGTSVSASRLASGERPLHRELEAAISRLLGTGDSMVLVGGFGTNETVVGHLMGEGDLILHDSLIHASVQSGCKSSGAASRPFPHNNWEALDGILRQERGKYR